MDIAIESSTDPNGRSVLRVAGAVDLQTRDKLLEAGHAALANNAQSLVLDLDEVSFIDSTGIGALVELGHDAADEGGALVIRNPSPRVTRILEISGLADVWQTELSQ